MGAKRWITCELCGKTFLSRPSSRFCPECRQLRRKQEKNTVARVCSMCDKKFFGARNAKYCPECRRIKNAERNREYRKRHRAGKADVIGETVRICKKCGQKFVITSPSQQYCKACTEEARREHRREVYRNTIQNDEQKKHHRLQFTRSRNRRCVICGRPITRHTSTRTCDDEACRKCFLFLRHARNSYRMGKRKNPPTMEEARKRFGISYNKMSSNIDK